MALQSIKIILTKAFLKFFPSGHGQSVLAPHWQNIDWQVLVEKFLELRNLCITASLIPLFWIIIDIVFDRLGANPTQAFTYTPWRLVVALFMYYACDNANPKNHAMAWHGGLSAIVRPIVFLLCHVAFVRLLDD